jgi:PKD repeat protein
MKNIILISAILISTLLISCKKDPISDFSFSDLTKVGEDVKFSNLSSNSEKYNWDFGDGLYSIEKEPIHVYKKPGKYNVTLNVKGEGGSASITKPINITGITYVIINTTGAVCNNLCSFSYNGSEIENLVEHGTLSTMRSTDIVITDKTEIYIAFIYSYYTLVSVEPFILKENIHNVLKITSTTRFYGSIKKSIEPENSPLLNNLLIKLEAELKK